MPAWEPHARREAALAAIERALAATGPSAERLLARADLLAALGRGEAAQAAYLDLLKVAPDHLAGLNNFAALVHGQGYLSAARTLYAQAAACHPGDPMSQVNLANSLIEVGETEAAAAALEAALAARPGYAPAHQALARLASDRGDEAAACEHLSAAFAARPVIELPYSGAAAPIEVLLLISGVQADIPLRHVLDPAVFRVTALAPAFFGSDALPPHQLVFNAIGDADLGPEALDAAARLVQRTTAPVINPPDRVALTGRVANARRLGALPGVVAAASVSVSKDEAAAIDDAWLAARGLALPLAARAPGYHTGRHFERIDRLDQLPGVLAGLPGDEAILMRFIDTRGADGLYRKYRAMIVDSALFPLHLAVSRSWKVHYFTADMADRPDHRAEDAAFVADMASVIGEGAMRALEHVRVALGLDYAGIDFALSPEGEVVVFEANATMIVHPPPPEPIWDYRRAPTARILDAVRAMIVGR
jgi:tetratricopeptide (TPR) repeat protein